MTKFKKTVLVMSSIFAVSILTAGIVKACNINQEYYDNCVNHVKITEKIDLDKEYTEQDQAKTVFDVPNGKTNFCAYMDYRTITDPTSEQYKFQQICWTDSQGIRRQGDDVCIALGSYYGTQIGSRYIITTDEGNEFTAVLADCKADCHTDSLHQYRPVSYGYKNVVEFVVDTEVLDYDIAASGNIGNYNNYSGNITKIERIL